MVGHDLFSVRRIIIRRNYNRQWSNLSYSPEKQPFQKLFYEHFPRKFGCCGYFNGCVCDAGWGDLLYKLQPTSQRILLANRFREVFCFFGNETQSARHYLRQIHSGDESSKVQRKNQLEESHLDSFISMDVSHDFNTEPFSLVDQATSASSFIRGPYL